MIAYRTPEPTGVYFPSWQASDNLTELSGSSSAVERQLPKLDVAGSIPVSRSTNQSLSGSDFLGFLFVHENITKLLDWRILSSRSNTCASRAAAALRRALSPKSEGLFLVRGSPGSRFSCGHSFRSH